MILTEEQRLIRETARSYASEHIAFRGAWDRDATFPAEALRGLPLNSVSTACWCPGNGGGCDIGYVAAALVLEEIGVADAACSTIVSVTNSVGCMPLLQYGTAQHGVIFLRRSRERSSLHSVLPSHRRAAMLRGLRPARKRVAGTMS